MTRTRVVGPIVAIVLWSAPTGAVAAPPVPGNDSLAVAGSGTADVMANDRDPDGDALAVVSTTAPSHGAVRCSALGACNFDADAGYIGTDTFAYTVRDPGGLEASASVTVTIAAAPVVIQRLAPRDDDVQTLPGAALEVAVLANDAGAPPLRVTANGPPAHGTATCSDGTTCIYRPDAGFSGTDGFVYTVRDATNATVTAAVHVTVAPPRAGFGVHTSGDPAVGIEGGESASWAVSAPTTPSGVSGDALRALTAPSIATRLTGAHALDTGSIKSAPGWNAVANADGTLTTTAGPRALLGEALSQPYPRPLPPVSQGTGGDGHVPILVGTRVYAFFHHSFPTSVTCVDRVTSQLCPGYPRRLTVGTTNIPGPGAVVGTRIYVHLLLAPSFTQTGSVGLFCWDTATDRTCGSIIVARVEGAGNPTASAPVLIAGRIYFAGNGRLYCVDPAAGAPCESLPTGLSTNLGSEYDIVAHGSRVFASQLSGARVACIDVTARDACPGWPTPRVLGEANVINQFDATGTVVGVCTVTTGAGHCVRDDNPATVTALARWPATDNYYQITQEAETGTRTLVASLSRGGVGCWDWTTLAPCAGGDYDSGGWLSVDSNRAALPSGYGATWDGSCVVALGDPGLIFTADPGGSAPCTSLQTGTERQTIDLRDQRCDGTAGEASWTGVRLEDAKIGELRSTVVTIRDAETGAVLASRDLTLGPLDLSAIDPVLHPEITLDSNAVSMFGNPAWTDGIPPRVRIEWKSDPQQLCFTSSPPIDCAAMPAPILVASALTGTSSVSEARVLVTRASTCPVVITEPRVEPKVDVPPPVRAAELLLACSDRRVVLEDVFTRGGKVVFLGVANRRFVGSRVNIILTATGKRVARATVDSDGRFSSTAPLPPLAIRGTSGARYQARIQTDRSLELKLTRRMQVTSVRVNDGTVTIKGRVSRPFAQRKADRRIQLQRRVSCAKNEVIKTFMPRPNGSFSVSVPTPAGQTAAVYRLHTLTRATAGNPKLFHTFTLPRAVDF